MSIENQEIVKQFYEAFARGDAETMVAFYHNEVTFEDPAFGKLFGEKARNMWRMLIERGGEDLDISFSNVKANGEEVNANWEAKYIFGKTGRRVHNKIRARFRFRDGKIIDHKDVFDFWKWSRMALGATGLFLGFLPLLRNKVRQQARGQLKKFMAKRAEELRA